MRELALYLLGLAGVWIFADGIISISLDTYGYSKCKGLINKLTLYWLDPDKPLKQGL